jgi:CDP-diacylglycerol---glycerol-3-phosphate 3-phosphatidyltransferase
LTSVRESEFNSRLNRVRKNISHVIGEPVAAILGRMHVSPNAVTVAGFLGTIVAAVLIALGQPFIAGWVVLFAGFLDMLDGMVARMTNRVTAFGGVLDSTLDRLSEASLLIGVLWVYAQAGMAMASLLTALALVGSLMVSYLRARAEGIGLDCKVGILTRSERVIVFALALLFSHFESAMPIALIVIIFLSFFTAGQRLLFVYQHTKDK